MIKVNISDSHCGVANCYSKVTLIPHNLSLVFDSQTFYENQATLLKSVIMDYQSIMSFHLQP